MIETRLGGGVSAVKIWLFFMWLLIFDHRAGAAGLNPGDFFELIDHGRNSSRRLNDAGSLPAIRLTWSRSYDSVGWTRGRDPSHDGTKGCIHPAPFGQQCTAHRADALYSCIGLNCQGIVCPDQRPYQHGKPAKGILGPICQIRNHNDANERNHGMCKPNGCTRWDVSRGTLRTLAPSLSILESYPDAALAVILPQRLLRYECREATATGPTYCGCLDIGGSILAKQSISPTPGDSTSGEVVCVVGELRKPQPLVKTW